MATSVVIALDADYAYVLLSVCIMAAQCMLIGFSVGGARREAFNQDFFHKAKSTGLLEEHKRATGSDKLPRGGYPDMGNGRFSALLPYELWYKFNNAQRAHHNYLETLTPMILFTLVFGLKFPIYAAAGAGLAILGRVLYTLGYKSSGPGGRVVGVALYDVAIVVAFVGAVYSCYVILMA